MAVLTVQRADVLVKQLPIVAAWNHLAARKTLDQELVVNLLENTMSRLLNALPLRRGDFAGAAKEPIGNRAGFAMVMATLGNDSIVADSLAYRANQLDHQLETTSNCLNCSGMSSSKKAILL